MKRLALPLLLAGAGVLAGCAANTGIQVRSEPTYEEAKSSLFVAHNRDAITALLSGLDMKKIAETPLLVATVVNVNDLRKTAPLGRTLSEQYASQLANQGLLVKELKLRGDIYVREETGELMLSRELKDIAKVHSAGLVVVGTYSAAVNATFVSLKLVKTDTGQIIKGHDYALPNNADVNRLLTVK
jgi:hypothetical protein